MHTWLGISSLAISLLASLAALAALRYCRSWATRRESQVAALAAPAVGLGVGLAGLRHFFEAACYLSAPDWDQLVGVALPVGASAVAIGAAGVGATRYALMRWLLARSVAEAGSLQRQVNRLARQFGVSPPQVRLIEAKRPIAFVGGLRRATLVMSTWFNEALEPVEIEALLAHELGHVARRDHTVAWLTLWLRDTFCYLPTSWVAHAQLRWERELASDDAAVAITGRPLALASALAKTWRQALAAPSYRLYPAFTGVDNSIEARIERLMRRSPQVGPKPRWSRVVARAAIAIGLMATGGVQAINITFIMGPFECHTRTVTDEGWPLVGSIDRDH